LCGNRKKGLSWQEGKWRKNGKTTFESKPGKKTRKGRPKKGDLESEKKNNVVVDQTKKKCHMLKQTAPALSFKSGAEGHQRRFARKKKQQRQPRWRKFRP